MTVKLTKTIHEMRTELLALGIEVVYSVGAGSWIAVYPDNRVMPEVLDGIDEGLSVLQTYIKNGFAIEIRQRERKLSAWLERNSLLSSAEHGLNLSEESRSKLQVVFTFDQKEESQS